MKKRIVIMLTVALIGLLVVGGTLAWFTAEAKPVINSFKAGTLEINLVDNFDEENAQNVNPGDCYDKVVYVENTGTKSAFIRVKLTPVLKDPEGNNLNQSVVTYNILNDWVLHTDGYYYYPYAVDAGGKTLEIIKEVCFAGKEMTDVYQGATFTLTVEAEAIQASNGAALNAWGVDPPTLLVAR